MTLEQEQLVNDNLKLIHHTLHTYFPFLHMDMDKYDDAAQQGYLYLCKAAESYDPEKGTFGTYAIKTIRGYMGHYLKKSSWYLGDPRYGGSTVVSYDVVLDGDGKHDECFLDRIEDCTDYFEHEQLRKTLIDIFKTCHQDPEMGERIFELAEQGYTYREIGKELGVSRTVVGKVIGRAYAKYNEIREKKED